jgi:hypothetical protein
MRQFGPILDGGGDVSLPSINVDRKVLAPVVTVAPPITSGPVQITDNGAIGSPPRPISLGAVPNLPGGDIAADLLNRPMSNDSPSINGAPPPASSGSGGDQIGGMLSIFGPRSIDTPLPSDPHSGDGTAGTAMNQAPAYGATTSAPGVNGNLVPLVVSPPTDMGIGPNDNGPYNAPKSTTVTTAPPATTSTPPATTPGATGGGALAGSGSVIDGLTSMLGGYSGLNNPLDGVQTATQGALQGVTPTAVPTGSSSNPALIVTALATIGLGVFWWMHAHKKKGAPAHV